MNETLDLPKLPKLRFRRFADKGEGTQVRRHEFADIFDFSTGRGIKQGEASPELSIPCVRYGELYHLYGEVIRNIINKTDLPRNELTFSYGDEILIPSAGEDPMDIGAASALTLADVAIGRTINVLRPKDKTVILPIFAAYYINSVLRATIAKLARGSSISNVYNSDLKNLHLFAPSLPEQLEIQIFLETVDERINLLRQRRSALQAYKKAITQRLLSGKLRFSRDDGSTFPDWQEKQLSDVLIEHGERGTGEERVHSVPVHKGVIDQVEHLGRSFSAANTDHYSLVKPGDVIYTKSPTGDFPFGIIKQSRLGVRVIVSPLYGVFSPETYALGYLLNEHFLSAINTHNYLKQLVQKGAKNTINITNKKFLQGKMQLPVDHDEQKKIADFIAALDAKIDATAAQLETMQIFKKGMLQRVFVQPQS